MPNVVKWGTGWIFSLFLFLPNGFFHDAYAIIRQRKMKTKNAWYKWEFKVNLLSSSDLNVWKEEILKEKLVLNMWNWIGFTVYFAFSTDFSRIIYCTEWRRAQRALPMTRMPESTKCQTKHCRIRSPSQQNQELMPAKTMVWPSEPSSIISK